jgi:hypothetical protein
VKDEWTEDELQELHARLSCKEWRMRNLYMILPQEGSGLVPFVLRAEQEQFMRERHTRNFVPKARKLGMSTFIVIDYLDECVFNPLTYCAHIDKKQDDAKDKLHIARMAWENGPRHPDAGIAELWRWIHEQNPLVTDNGSLLEWKNGSSQSADVSFTGGTPQRLHISEYGPIAAQKPAKAQEIKRGSMNAVPPDGIIDIETTMEGGRFGECYLIFSNALKACGLSGLTKLDWKLHFFPWHGHPSYRLPGRTPTLDETAKYFRELHEKHGLDIPPDRQAWYEVTKRTQGEDMYQQFPSVVEECDRHVVANQILPEMTTLRAKGRVREFEAETGLPIFAFWDLGAADNSAGWCIQPAGKDTNWLAWSAGEGLGAAGVAQLYRHWESMFGPLAGLFVPHDADLRDKGSGKTYKSQLIECGIPASLITVVPRTPDVWVGIAELKKVLPNSWFHARCDVEQRSETGAKMPSGVGRLEGYRRTPPSSTGAIREAPFPDICSHTADAARTYAEAKALGLVRASGAAAGPFREAKVVGGFRGSATRAPQRNAIVRR